MGCDRTVIYLGNFLIDVSSWRGIGLEMWWGDGKYVVQAERLAPREASANHGGEISATTRLDCFFLARASTTGRRTTFQRY